MSSLSAKSRNFNRAITERDIWTVLALRLGFVNSPQSSLTSFFKNKDLKYSYIFSLQISLLLLSNVLGRIGT
jgi:hypothetical protein